MAYYAILLGADGHKDISILPYDEEPSEREEEGLMQTVGMMYWGCYQAESPVEALAQAYEDIENAEPGELMAGCVA